MKQVILILSCMLTWIFLSAQTLKWTWIGGDTTANHRDSVNKPGSRSASHTWIDKDGNFYMFGGSAVAPVYPSAQEYQFVNTSALWKYSPSGNAWTKLSGSDASMPNQDVGSSTNTPGSSSSSGASWIDENGNFWLYGGKTGTRAWGTHSDLWKFDPSISRWTFMSGYGTDVRPIYGTKGIPDPANNPGARQSVTRWADNKGNLYLYGGALQNVPGYYFGDVWKYNIATKLWTWVRGKEWDPDQPDPPVYGTMGVFASENTPGNAINRSVEDLIDSSGIISMVIFREKWSYSTLTDQWAWISGDRNLPQPVTPAPVRRYGVKGVSSASNHPGVRSSSTTWKDAAGNLWLFGGRIEVISSFLSAFFNDLWKYTAQTHLWTWMAGDSTVDKKPTYGILGIAAESNQPGGRAGSTVWKDAKGDVWLFGGSPKSNYITIPYSVYLLNDLWKLSGTNGALPVKLSGFSAARQQQHVVLRWSATQEQNSKAFIVERSADGVQFTSIGTVAAAGSAAASQYGFTDNAPLEGNNFYRLKQVDLDNAFEYSTVAKVLFQTTAFAVRILKNPVHNELSIAFETDQAGAIQIQVVDASGHLLLNRHTTLSQGASTYTVPVKELAEGVYYISIVKDKKAATKRFYKSGTTR